MYLHIISLCLLFGVCYAQECNVAVVAVASVFGTLAVVLLILGVLGFLLWKKRQAFLSPKANATNKNGNKKGDGTLLNDSLSSPTRDGHVNPAFNDTSADLSTMEEGLSGFDSPDGKKSTPGKNGNQKTWSSLPRNDFSSPFTRQGSCGSLDDNYLHTEPEVMSVWLQSQDFIGLGFNISGNMRDGIFVSHVHNRGPAIESNKVKVGDKILNVTISFENIVYEDALTILSYASPYPVNVMLQKEKQLVNEKRLTESNNALSHPLYRSQSLDALNRAGLDALNRSRKDSFKPKRTYSEMKPETRKDNSVRKQLSGMVPEMFENGGGDNRGSTHAKITSDILVHKADDAGFVNIDLSSGGDTKNGLDVSHASGRVDDYAKDLTGKAKDKTSALADDMSGKVSNEVDVFSKTASDNLATQVDDHQMTLEVDSTVQGVKDRKSSTAVEFASLMDKMLDMNQSSDEPFETMEVKNISNGPVAEDSFSASLSSENQFSPPTKPTRKKKRPSTASNSSDELSLSQSDIKLEDVGLLTSRKPVVEEVMTIVKVKDVSAAPRSYADCEAIEEESMIAEKLIKGDVSSLADKLELTEKEKDSEKEELPSPTLLRKILLDGIDNYQIKKKPEPEGDPVEEEMIQAVRVSREDCAPPLPKAPNSNQEVKSSKKVGVNNNLHDIDDELIDEIIAMNSRPIEQAGLPGRNTKENMGGVSYDIQVADLDKIENELRSEMGKDAPKSPTGGKAFEIREDLNGKMVNLEINKSYVTRTASEAAISKNNDQEDIHILRAGSLKDDKHHIENDFDWSGKRLIRSGSFSEIPQDNSVKDWTDQNKVSSEDITVVIPDNHKMGVLATEEDIKAKAEVFIKESLDLTNMSDISSSQSPSSTRSVSPYTPNGPPELSPLALKKALDFASSESYSSSSRTGSYSFNLNKDDDDDDDDAEC
ncbi:uncharacterized protein LOC126820349 isoform X2 [Patella vulgata]|uniref:uncharacterized protein LOC126820349 isoform X2 n=1 Tax=Patella vulgata TaxID=6465 RepID=UPI00217F58F8|nr:uncharacterized protein LOC126820349 isoform X2 [Patella vulgata]